MERQFQVLHGDALAVLRTLPAESVHCCVTSPPYWGLRDYGVPGQIGLERTPEEYVARIVEVFREVRRVLRVDGTCWLNIGDTYASGGRIERDPGKSKIHPAFEGDRFADGLRPDTPPGLNPKDLVGIPWRVAFALQADGWYLRAEIIWAKRAPMPESVRDRPTRSHEQLFLLAKSERYYYDAQAIAEPLERPEEAFRAKPAKFGGAVKFEGAKEQSRLHSGNEYRGTPTGTRNKRDVWWLGPEPFPEAHFAVFPSALVEPCILAGCPEGGTVIDPFCGSGTAGMVALRHGRQFIGIELNPEYVAMARRRIEGDAPLLNAEAEVQPPPPEPIQEALL
jgi:DNA modification methylase